MPLRRLHKGVVWISKGHLRLADGCLDRATRMMLHFNILRLGSTTATHVSLLHATSGASYKGNEQLTPKCCYC